MITSSCVLSGIKANHRLHTADWLRLQTFASGINFHLFQIYLGLQWYFQSSSCPQ